ncbi:MAG: glutamate--tRNA ligase [Acidimicrobiales bacterium]
MSQPPRVRFAPAPTGYLHVGSARSALFNWLHARHTGGTFVLRIEDTNASLATPEYYAAITQPLEWLGVDWDEGPYLQSERQDLYLAAVDQLVASGAAYLCDCTRDAIGERNKATGFKGGYDGHCRDRADVVDGDGVTVRFRAPDEGQTVIEDVVRGTVVFENAEFEDFVIRRGNGTPVFLVANAVDDHEMAITHVVRGEDLLNTTPKVILLWNALDYGTPPVYAHLPLLVGDDRKKLSKRKDSVALADFEADGFLPEAMANYLALLGWGPPDDVEVRPMAEIVELFDLGDVNKAPAFFDMKKLEHINGEYIRALDEDDLLRRLAPWVGASAPWPADRFDPDVLGAVIPHVRERLRRLPDIVPLVDWMFTVGAPVETDEKEIAKIAKAMGGEDVPAVLDASIEALGACDWDAETLEAVVRKVGDDLGAKSQVPVRIAVTGRRVGPPLFEPLELLDRELVIDRLQAARQSLD